MLINPRCGAQDSGFKAALLASVVLFGLATPAAAQTRTEAQAQDVAKQLQAWMEGIVGPKLPVPPGLLRVVPDGERYRVNVPLPLPVLVMEDGAGKPTEALFSAAVRPIEGTRWRIEALDLPARIQLSPDGAAALGGLAGTPASPTSKPTAEMRIRTQSASGVLDTSYGSESRLEWRMEGVSYAVQGLGSNSDSRSNVALYAGSTTLRPTRAGGLDIRTEAVMEGYSSVGDSPLGGPMRLAAKRVALRGELGALMTGQITAIIQTVVGLGVDAQAGGGDAKRQQAAKQDGLRKVIAALKGIMGGLTLEESVEGVEVEVMGQQGGLAKLTINLGGGAPADKFNAFLEVGLDGLKISGLPPHLTELLPRTMVLRPTVGNIDVKALTALAEEAAGDGVDERAMQRKFTELLTKGGTEVGLERLAIDLGFARLQATATATIVGEERVKGTGEITMTGFDALMDKVQKMPEGPMAIPVMALLGGLAKTEGDRKVWRLVFSDDQKVLVNGMDITKLGGR